MSQPSLDMGPQFVFEDCLMIGDCIEQMSRLPAKSVDLVFADPPYNIEHKPGSLARADGRGSYQSVDDDWDKFEDYAAYKQFTRDWLAAARRVMKPTGAIWVMGSYHNIHGVGDVMREMAFWVLSEIVWAKRNPPPNWSGRRFQHAHETLLWAKGSEKQKKYTFNYHVMKEYNDGKQCRDVWGIPICQGKERLKGPDGKKLHTTQKPEALLERVIRASTNPGDTILDPFFGTGTTGAVARRLGRHWIGIDLDETYSLAAIERINSVTPDQGECLTLEGRKAGIEVFEREAA